MMSGRSGKLLLGSEFVASEFAGVSQSPWLATLGGKLAEEEEEECDAVWIAEMLGADVDAAVGTWGIMLENNDLGPGPASASSVMLGELNTAAPDCWPLCWWRSFFFFLLRHRRRKV